MCHGALLAAAVAAIKPSRFTLPKAAAKMQRVRSLASAPREKKNQPKAARASAKFDFAAVSWSPRTAPMAHSLPEPGSESTSSGTESPRRRNRFLVSEQEISFSVVIAGLARQGRPYAAANFLEAMVTNGLSPNVVVFNAVIAAFAGHADVPEAVNWFRKMEDQGLKPNVVTLTSVIDACAKAGKADEAVRWLHEIEERGLQPNRVSYNAVINAFARRGDVSGALHWLERMQPAVEPDKVSYNSVIHSCALSKDPSAGEVAESVFKRMRLNNMWPTSATLNALARAVGTDRRNILCAELGIDGEAVPSQRAKHRTVRPLADLARLKDRQ
ncbi:unnamed protein product [Symbiodinium sp. CCMP2456]|nr:unnamed protein product [Symbiodinium sp. CCMP2456]